jgi:hypothetical protein
MGRYPEAEDRDSNDITNPDSKVVDLESYRRRRAVSQHDTNANQEPRGEGEDGAGNAPIEGNHKD